jgi:hypothetical protein
MILIDNYHYGYLHIHPDHHNHEKKIKIKNNDHNIVHLMVYNHIFYNKKIIIEKLIKELQNNDD